jgi:colicin import membrane protein
VSNNILKSERTKEVEEQARKLSTKFSKLNATNNKIHKSQKAFYLAGGKFVDALKNKNRDIIAEMQERLDEIKNYSRNLRLAEIAKLKAERISELQKFNSEIIPESIGEMEADVWENYLFGIETAYLAQKERERKEEEARIAQAKADEAERERIRKENEELKKAAIERERLAKIEAEKRAKAERERIAKEEAAQKARAEKAAKDRAKFEAEIKAEKERAAKIEAELRAKEEAARKAKEEAAAKIEAELNKGDSAKVKDLIADLEALKTKYSFKSAKNKKKYADVGILIEKVINHINK